MFIEIFPILLNEVRKYKSDRFVKRFCLKCSVFISSIFCQSQRVLNIVNANISFTNVSENKFIFVLFIERLFFK